MIFFLLGVITGLLLAIIWIILSVKVTTNPHKLAETIQTKFQPKKKGAIIQAPSDDLYALQSKFKQNDAENKDTILDDLLS
jgi:hypothetical protein